MEDKIGLDFIKICTVDSDERLEKLSEEYGLDLETLKENKEEINYLMDFMQWWDGESHFTDKLDDNDEENITFLRATIHSHLPCDLLGLIILLTNSLRHQANVLLRRTIEYVLFSAWLDLVSRKEGTFDYYWDPQWKTFYSRQSMGKRDLNKQLDKVYEEVAHEKETKAEFKERFFREGNDLDFLRILSKPICENCVEERTDKTVYAALEAEETAKEGKRQTNFEYPEECFYCELDSSEIAGYVVFFPETSFINEFLKKEFDDSVINSLSDLKKVYNAPSNHFVHYSPRASNTEEEVKFKIGNKKINLYGFEGATYVFRKLSYILCNSYMILKNDFTEHSYSGTCKNYENEFEYFSIDSSQ